MMSILDKYPHIGFDFDDTLLYGNNSEYFQEYILSHPEKTYSIITHRTPDVARAMDAELKQFSKLDLSYFKNVIPCPERIKMEFEVDQRMRRKERLPQIDINTSIHDMSEGERKFVYWKGYVCSRIGAKVLLDDLPSLSEQGCIRYKIDFINSRTENFNSKVAA